MSQSEMFERLGREIAVQLCQPLDEHVESAEAKLNDDGLVGFALVAMRQNGGDVQTVSQRCIDPEAVMDSERDPEAVIDAIHEGLCQTFDEEVRNR